MPSKKRASPAATPTKTSSEAGELQLIRSLAAILNDTGLTEIEIDHKGAKVRVAKSMTISASAAPVMAMPASAAHLPAATAAAAAPAAIAAAAGDAVKSPMVGTAYLSPSPGAPQFISVGATVKQGQTLLIIEAMKTMNQIPAPKSGTVTQIMIENGQPVEFGEALLVIE
jgi:acetyl-CoA carboxylase biotin carboxyl carrier protein